MKKYLPFLTVFLLVLVQTTVLGQAPDLGATSTFAVFTGSGALNNDGASEITGDVGSYTVTPSGFNGPGLVVGSIYGPSDPITFTASGDVLTAYNDLASMTPTDVIGIGLGSPGLVTIGPGVHSIGGAATLTGTLTLDGGGDPNAIFVFQINGAFATASNSRIELINMANPCNVYWQVNGQFDLETGSVFVGTVINSAAVNLFVGSSLFGRVLSKAGAINVHTAEVSVPVCTCLITAPIVSEITQPDCYTATGSVMLSGLPSGSWTINPGAIEGTGTSKTIPDLAPGTFNFTVSNDALCISAPSADVVIDTFIYTQSYTTPSVGTITQPTCAIPTGSVILNDLPATGTWTVNPGGVTGTGSTTTISGLASGTYNFTVSGPDVCYTNSPPTGDVVITAAVAAPTITLTQPTTCTTPSGVIAVSGLTGDCYKFSIDGSDYTNSTGIFTHLPGGTYTVTAISPDGCITTGVTVEINSLPVYETPSVGTITQPTCEVGTGSVVLNGLPATGNWYINPGGIAGTGTSKTIYGLVPGTYNYTVTSPEVCWHYSAPTTNIVIDAAVVAAPTVALTQPTTCTSPTGMITVTAPTGAGMTYSIDGSSYTNSTGIFNSVAPGTYMVTAKDAGACISAETSVTIYTQPVTLASATLQPTCKEATGTITVTSPTAGGGMTYSIDGSTYTNTTGIFTSVPTGTYSVTSKSSDLCVSLGQTVEILNPGPLAAPTATVTQPTECILPTGTITVSAPTGAGMTYSINGSTYTNTTGIFADVAAGTYTLSAMNADECISSGTIVTINEQPSISAIATLQPTCTEATGTITVTSPPAEEGRTYSIDGSTYSNTSGIFTFLATGIYTVTSSLNGCTSLGKSVMINAQPDLPAAPSVTVTQPVGEETTGTIDITDPDICLTYSIGDSYTQTTTYPALPLGSYTVTTKDWYSGCISSDTLVTITDASTTTEKSKVDSDFNIYPIPNQGQFTVNINTLTEQHFEIRVCNVIGSLIYEEKNIVVNGSLEHRIDLAQARKGCYYVTLKGDFDSITKKIIVIN